MLRVLHCCFLVGSRVLSNFGDTEQTSRTLWYVLQFEMWVCFTDDNRVTDGDLSLQFSWICSTFTQPTPFTYEYKHLYTVWRLLPYIVFVKWLFYLCCTFSVWPLLVTCNIGILPRRYKHLNMFYLRWAGATCDTGNTCHDSMINYTRVTPIYENSSDKRNHIYIAVFSTWNCSMNMRWLAFSAHCKYA